ncbi:MAG: sigma-54 dependent transcriptional regulator [Gemmataceae bacterium]|nr:sigma-54 dependent transcriptional regulator [Gemmataceae bacterium]MCI0742683.1 sigma-54 dependent transcriptional regulator [Gemmataceae bacterium]
MAGATETRILVVDDEPIIRDSLAEFLTQEGFAVTPSGSGEDALVRAKEIPFDAALCDIQLPGINGLELLDRLLKINSQMFVLLITAYGTVDSAVAAFQRGAHDYLMKPIILEEVLTKIRRLLAYRDLYRENQFLRRELNRTHNDDAMVGKSSALERVREIARKVAPTRSTVLLVGESGTGKELVASAIHRQGLHPEGRFLAVNCAAIPHDLLENQLFGHRKGAFTGADKDSAGMFVHAGNGTVFLDEIAEMPPATQAKLLRAIEQKEILPVGAQEPVAVEARILAATNKNLSKEVESGRFREDLYYRLNVVRIDIPPLRERREDIPELVDYLLARHAHTLGKRITGVSHEAMQILLACPWKGNVRELDNALQRAVILGEGPLVLPADLPPDLAPRLDDPALVNDLAEAVRRFERQHIERILKRAPDKKEAARLMGLGLSSLYRRLAELGIQS